MTSRPLFYMTSRSLLWWRHVRCSNDVTFLVAMTSCSFAVTSLSLLQWRHVHSCNDVTFDATFIVAMTSRSLLQWRHEVYSYAQSCIVPKFVIIIFIILIIITRNKNKTYQLTLYTAVYARFHQSDTALVAYGNSWCPRTRVHSHI